MVPLVPECPAGQPKDSDHALLQGASGAKGGATARPPQHRVFGFQVHRRRDGQPDTALLAGSRVRAQLRQPGRERAERECQQLRGLPPSGLLQR